jgi:signal transduction histidine kinase
MNAAQDALLLLDEAGCIQYCNLQARLLAHSLNPDKTQDELLHLRDWQPGLLSDSAMHACRESGSWIGAVRIAGSVLRDRIAQVHLVALGPQRTQPFAMCIRDISQEYAREQELHDRNAELEIAYTKLKSAQEMALHTEKLASIGQLAAGVAHEINNPIAYVKSNLNMLRLPLAQLLRQARVPECENDLRRAVSNELNEDSMGACDEALAVDVRDLITESLEGVDRVCRIVSDLKDFSHQDQIENWTMADLHAGLDSTLNIVWNEIKYKAHVVKSYGDLPLIECIPSQLNQVFMNLLVNASQAIDNSGIITITSECSGDQVSISIGDNGKGIPAEALPRIFDPFFTTKDVGHGTGLGLAISYGVIAKHHGVIEVTSVPGEGTLFMLKLPIAQPR